MVCEILQNAMEDTKDDIKWLPIRRRITFFALNFLFTLHGLPVPVIQQSFCWRFGLAVFRVIGVVSVNFYVVYRTYKLVEHRNLTFDTFPLINAAVSACVADSVLIYRHKFGKFAKQLFEIQKEPDLHLPTSSLIKLLVYYSILLSYVLVCSIVFPINANLWFDAASRRDSKPDFLHRPSIKPCTHILIFVVCSGNVVTHLMLYCFVCCLLQEILRRINFDLKGKTTLESIQEAQSRFVEAANLVKSADSLFSLFGIVGLGAVFARACSCIHFYLNMKSPFKDSWFFLIVQVVFDLCALTAVSCFAASIPDEARRITPAVFHASRGVSTRRVDFHARCLAFAKVVMSSDVHLSAWKLFPFTRKVVPTVIGVTISYIAVIIQMHHAASSELINFEKSTLGLLRNSTNGTSF